MANDRRAVSRQRRAAGIGVGAGQSERVRARGDRHRPRACERVREDPVCSDQGLVDGQAGAVRHRNIAGHRLARAKRKSIRPAVEIDRIRLAAPIDRAEVFDGHVRTRDAGSARAAVVARAACRARAADGSVTVSVPELLMSAPVTTPKPPPPPLPMPEPTPPAPPAPPGQGQCAGIAKARIVARSSALPPAPAAARRVADPRAARAACPAWRRRVPDGAASAAAARRVCRHRAHAGRTRLAGAARRDALRAERGAR